MPNRRSTSERAILRENGEVAGGESGERFDPAVIGPLGFSMDAGGRAETSTQSRIIQQRAQTRCNRTYIPRVHDVPRLTVDHRFVRATTPTRDTRQPGGAGLEEHDPEPFGFETAPPIPTQHREDVGSSVRER